MVFFKIWNNVEITETSDLESSAPGRSLRTLIYCIIDFEQRANLYTYMMADRESGHECLRWLASVRCCAKNPCRQRCLVHQPDDCEDRRVVSIHDLFIELIGVGLGSSENL